MGQAQLENYLESLPGDVGQNIAYMSPEFRGEAWLEMSVGCQHGVDV